MNKMIQRGHEVLDYDIVRDEQDMILKQIQKGMKDPAIEVVLVNGGIGVAKRDVTIEVVESLLDKEMPGFGEIFRMLSYTEDIGSAAILSRAIAGISGETAIFSTQVHPGQFI